MQFVRNGPPLPGEEKVWLRDKSYRAHRDRIAASTAADDDDDQIKVTIHTMPNYDQNNIQTNDKGNFSKWLNDNGESIEMLEMTHNQNGNGREQNGLHIKKYNETFAETTSTEPNDAYDNL